MGAEQTNEARRFVPPPGYTQTPNVLFDEVMVEISTLAELKVTMAIARSTFGWGVEERRLDLEKIMQLTGLSRQSAQKGVTAGLERGYLGRRREGHGFVYGLRVAPANNVVSSPPAEESRLLTQLSPASRPPSNKGKKTLRGKENNKGADAPASDKKPSKPKPRDTFKPNEEDPVDLAIVEVFEHWAKGTGDEGARLTQHRASKIKARLREKAKGHSSDEKEVALAAAKEALIFAVDGMINSKWHHDSGQLDFMLMFREEERITFFTNKRRAQVGQQQSTPSGNGEFAAYGRVVEHG